jgi:uncharacterized coiled-coil DUF342 family protein
MSTLFQELKITRKGRRYQLLKLKNNRHKKHWRLLTMRQLRFALLEEVDELKDAFYSFPMDYKSIIDECADIKNFADMIIANAERKIKKPSRIQQFKLRLEDWNFSRKLKCDYLNCAAGLGLAGMHRCRFGWDFRKKECDRFKPEPKEQGE